MARFISLFDPWLVGPQTSLKGRGSEAKPVFVVPDLIEKRSQTNHRPNSFGFYWEYEGNIQIFILTSHLLEIKLLVDSKIARGASTKNPRGSWKSCIQLGKTKTFLPSFPILTVARARASPAVLKSRYERYSLRNLSFAVTSANPLLWSKCDFHLCRTPQSEVDMGKSGPGPSGSSRKLWTKPTGLV